MRLASPCESPCTSLVFFSFHPRARLAILCVVRAHLHVFHLVHVVFFLPRCAIRGGGGHGPPSHTPPRSCTLLSVPVIPVARPSSCTLCTPIFAWTWRIAIGASTRIGSTHVRRAFVRDGAVSVRAGATYADVDEPEDDRRKLTHTCDGRGTRCRSEAMQLVQLIVPAEAAHETVEELGELGLMQFKDLNAEQSAFQRNYATQVKRCDELARKLRFFRDQVEKQQPEWMPRHHGDGTLDVPGSLLRLGNGAGSSQHSQRWDMDELETKLEEMEQRMLEANANNDQLRKSHAELVEMKMVMERASRFFDEARILAEENDDAAPLQTDANLPLERTDSGRPLLEGDSLQRAAMARGLGYVTGLVLQEKMLSFERVLFRATRGNMFMKQVRPEQPIEWL